MNQEVKKAVMAYKVASGKATAQEHKGWSYYRGDDRLCNGVIIPRNTYYKPKGK